MKKAMVVLVVMLWSVVSGVQAATPTLQEQIDACWRQYDQTVLIVHQAVREEMAMCLGQPDPVLCQANALNTLRVMLEGAWLGLLQCIQDAVQDHFGDPNFLTMGGLFE